MITKFLPKKSIDVEICDIYEDRDAVIVQHTDTAQSNTCYNAEALGFRFGIKPTIFHWPYTGLQTGLSEINDTGVLKFGVYIPTDRWRRDSENNGYLPDYNATVLSEAGALFYGKTAGQTKPAGYPNQGQELFDYTGGIKGYDVASGLPGSEGNVEFIREMEYIDNWFVSTFGRLPSGGCDRQGKIGSKEIYMPYYLGMRSTQTDYNTSYYGLDRLDYIWKKLTSRWENGFLNNDIPTYNTRLIDGINNAFVSKGLFNDFVHWHRTLTATGGIQLLEQLYTLIHDTVGGRNAWYAGYGEASEYYWFRQMTKTVRGSIIDGRLYLIADFDDDFINEKLAGIDKKLLYNRIKQPLSVKIDLTGTPLEGAALQGADMIHLGNSQFIVDIPFLVEENGFKAVVLSPTTSPIYKDLSSPGIISNVSGVITSNVPTKAVLFNRDFTQQMTVVKRSNLLRTTHDFSGLAGTRIGLVNKWGASTLVTV